MDEEDLDDFKDDVRFEIKGIRSQLARRSLSDTSTQLATEAIAIAAEWCSANEVVGDIKHGSRLGVRKQAQKGGRPNDCAAAPHSVSRAIDVSVIMRPALWAMKLLARTEFFMNITTLPTCFARVGVIADNNSPLLLCKSLLLKR